MIISNKETGLCLYTCDSETGEKMERENTHDYINNEINLFLEKVEKLNFDLEYFDPYEEMKEPVFEFIEFEKNLINFINSCKIEDIVKFCNNYPSAYLSYKYDISSSKLILKLDNSLSLVWRFSSVGEHSYCIEKVMSKEECLNLLEKFDITFDPKSNDSFLDFVEVGKFKGYYFYSFAF